MNEKIENILFISMLISVIFIAIILAVGTFIFPYIIYYLTNENIWLYFFILSIPLGIIQLFFTYNIFNDK
jgi:hypothetical protein